VRCGERELLKAMRSRKWPRRTAGDDISRKATPESDSSNTDPAIRTPFMTYIRMRVMRQGSEGVVANSIFSLISEALKFGKPH